MPPPIMGDIGMGLIGIAVLLGLGVLIGAGPFWKPDGVVPDGMLPDPVLLPGPGMDEP